MDSNSEILFGEVSPKIVIQLKRMMCNYYIKNIESYDKWNCASKKEKAEFMTQTKRFKSDLELCIRNSNNNDICKLVKEKTRLMSDEALLEHYKSKFEEWLNIFNKNLKTDSDVMKDLFSTIEEGPASELEYWKDRLLEIQALS